MRLFAAVLPPDHAVDHLDAFLEPRRSAAGFRWAPADQLHVTCAFMARVPERALDDLVERLAAAVGRRTSFATRVAGGGAFPDVARARVLWAGLDLDEAGRVELDRLAAGCRTAAATSGVEVDGARFRPHVTVARLGVPDGVSDWVRLLDAYDGPTWSVGTVALVASHLGEGPRGRPRHEVLETFALG